MNEIVLNIQSVDKAQIFLTSFRCIINSGEAKKLSKKSWCTFEEILLDRRKTTKSLSPHCFWWVPFFQFHLQRQNHICNRKYRPLLKVYIPIFYVSLVDNVSKSGHL